MVAVVSLQDVQLWSVLNEPPASGNVPCPLGRQTSPVYRVEVGIEAGGPSWDAELDGILPASVACQWGTGLTRPPAHDSRAMLWGSMATMSSRDKWNHTRTSHTFGLKAVFGINAQWACDGRTWGVVAGGESRLLLTPVYRL